MLGEVLDQLDHGKLEGSPVDKKEPPADADIDAFQPARNSAQELGVSTSSSKPLPSSAPAHRPRLRLVPVRLVLGPLLPMPGNAPCSVRLNGDNDAWGSALWVVMVKGASCRFCSCKLCPTLMVVNPSRPPCACITEPNWLSVSRLAALQAEVLIYSTACACCGWMLLACCWSCRLAGSRSPISCSSSTLADAHLAESASFCKPVAGNTCVWSAAGC